MKRTAFSLLVILAMALGTAGSASSAVSQEQPSADALLAEARQLKAPMGFRGRQILSGRRDQSFRANVAFSERWINSQIRFYNSARSSYKSHLRELMEGPGEGGIGMRKWVTDRANVAFWDNAVRSNIGDLGHARIVSLNAAFAPGSREYRLAFGGTRRYLPEQNTLVFQGTSFRKFAPARPFLVIPRGASLARQYDLTVRFDEALHDQIFRFYKAYVDRRVTQAQVQKFNVAYVLASGCAVSATAPKAERRALRYTAAVNMMAQTMKELGFEVDFAG